MSKESLSKFNQQRNPVKQTHKFKVLSTTFTLLSNNICISGINRFLYATRLFKMYLYQITKNNMDYNQTTSLCFVPIKKRTTSTPEKQTDTQEEKIQMSSLTFPNFLYRNHADMGCVCTTFFIDVTK